jgi:hypothetical protein
MLDDRLLANEEGVFERGGEALDDRRGIKGVGGNGFDESGGGVRLMNSRNDGMGRSGSDSEEVDPLWKYGGCLKLSGGEGECIFVLDYTVCSAVDVPPQSSRYGNRAAERQEAIL